MCQAPHSPETIAINKEANISLAHPPDILEGRANSYLFPFTHNRLGVRHSLHLMNAV